MSTRTTYTTNNNTAALTNALLSSASLSVSHLLPSTPLNNFLVMICVDVSSSPFVVHSHCSAPLPFVLVDRVASPPVLHSALLFVLIDTIDEEQECQPRTRVPTDTLAVVEEKKNKSINANCHSRHIGVDKKVALGYIINM
jgi:hypothetical protein|eukprot:scaffold2000_cov124-Alexandrium_tamarense.AAC.7